LQGEHLLNKHLKIVTGRIFAKRTQFVVGFSSAYPLRVAACLQPTRPKLTDLTREIPIDVNDPGLDIAVDRQIGVVRRGKGRT
jgi:hypothetical protein